MRRLSKRQAGHATISGERASTREGNILFTLIFIKQSADYVKNQLFEAGDHSINYL
jgi:hypothetical protein